jgi:lysozyme
MNDVPVCIDISHWEDFPDFEEVRASGVLGMIHKATEGTTYVDPNRVKNCSNAITAGLEIATYFWLKPGDGRAQAQFYLSIVRPVHGERVVIDYEEEGCTLDTLHDAVQALLDFGNDLKITIYSGHLIKQELDGAHDEFLAENTDLWLAQYSDAADLAWETATWPRWALWQYSETGDIPGVDSEVDVNNYFGSDDEFLDWITPGRGRPHPVAPPRPPARERERKVLRPHHRRGPDIPKKGGGDVPGWLVAMRAITGMTETPGSEDNPKILLMRDAIARAYPEMADYCALYQHDDTPWCGLCAAFCMTMAGIRPPFGPTDEDRWMWALAWGDDPGFVELDFPRLGCVVVMEREGGGHVTLYERTEGEYYVCRGGNQSDMVNESKYAINTVLALVWPKDAST